MIGRIIEITDLSSAEQELKALNVDLAGIRIMRDKAVFRVIKLKAVKPLAANILKQEMLSLGGEAAVGYGALDLSVKTTDVLLMGTIKQFKLLGNKLKQHQFGLPKVGEEITGLLNSYDPLPKKLRFRQMTLDLGLRTIIMGILNVTPDSFSDGGKFLAVEHAVQKAKDLIKAGADIIDVGGESTRPGAKPVPVQDELKRVIPVIKELRKLKCLISIDTTKAKVAEAALKAGASMVNDISGLRFDPKMAKVVAKYKVPLCIMHIKGKPRTMQKNTSYQDLMAEIIASLSGGLEIAKKAGILHEQIVVDPGIGFGKTLEQNLEILKHLKELKALGCPILVGTSRKSLIGQILAVPTDERVEGTAATVALAIAKGADIVRVHDVWEMKKVAKVADAVVKSRRD